MINPNWDQQKRETEVVQICREILHSSRTELYLSMRFLDQALAVLRYLPSNEIRFLATDGGVLYYQAEELIERFRRSPLVVTRSYLHLLFHCLFAHVFPEEDRDREYWDLACDIAVEHLLDHLYLKCVAIPRSPLRREVYGWLSGEMGTVTAQAVYRFLQRTRLQQFRLEEIKREFRRDDHGKWYEDSRKKPESEMQRKQWEDLRNKMQTEMETFSKEASGDAGELLEHLRIHNRRKQDYRTFLRKFAVLKEEMKVDLDSFDYIFYHYGMELYGNMPIIEPLETREEKKIEDFVIVIDTSMSCNGDLVRRFLEETYGLLTQEESFSRRIHIHILQCDEKVQSDVWIQNSGELRDYMEHFTLRGGGGTDFRPAFAYVEELQARKVFSNLRGLLYFTDGYGIYPGKMPLYQTAFVFMEEDYRDIDVPPWAMKLIVREEDLKGADWQYDEY